MSERAKASGRGESQDEPPLPVRFDVDPSRLRQPKKAERIADEIRRWIVRRQLSPGDRLPNEKELIAQLASSRGTVREAMKILEAQGLVQVTPGIGGGARVALISYESANYHLKNFFYFQTLSWAQVYAFRLQVEPHAAELASPHLTDSDIAQLEATIARCHDGMHGRISRVEHRQEEARFHRILATRCPNPLLRFTALFVTDMLSDFLRYRNIVGTDNNDFGNECLGSHEALMKLFRKRRSTGVAPLMRKHIEALASYLSVREQMVDTDLLMARQGTGDWPA
jgi:GntR family transcriptional regulator, transcriptional repressor for pyruvate dehydrogenase complex